jgi:hypothetical protein
LTDKEINEAVAFALGYRCDSKHDPLCYWDTPNRKCTLSILPPPFSTDIKAAWEILTDHCDEWHLDFRSTVTVRLSKKYEEAIATSDTAPKAICLAFLKMKEG